MFRFVVFFLLLTSSSVFSQVIIKKENKVLNRSPGYCAWCCLETLGKQQKIKPLYNLVDSRESEFSWEWDGKNWVKSPDIWIDYGDFKAKEHRSSGSHQAIVNKLSDLKVKYRYQNYHNYDKKLIKEAVKNNQGCLVVIRHWKADTIHDTHAIIVIDYNDKQVRFYDPNDINYTYVVTPQWFDSCWLGYALVVEKE